MVKNMDTFLQVKGSGVKIEFELMMLQQLEVVKIGTTFTLFATISAKTSTKLEVLTGILAKT